MKYNNEVLTFDNYREILGDEWNLDVLDEVRAALMDGLDVSPWLAACAEDPYRLQQIRVAMKQGIDSKYFSLSAQMIRRVRRLIMSDVNMDQLDPWVAKRLPTGHYDYLVQWVEHGWLIPDSLELTRCPLDKMESISFMLSRGMHDLAVEVSKQLWVSPTYAANLVMLEESGSNDPRFLERDWDEKVLNRLATATGKPYYGVMVEVLDRSDASEELVDAVHSLGKLGFPLADLTGKGFNPEQLMWIHQAYQEKLDVSSMMDPDLGVDELRSLYHSLVINSNKKFSGRL